MERLSFVFCRKNFGVLYFCVLLISVSLQREGEKNKYNIAIIKRICWLKADYNI